MNKRLWSHQILLNILSHQQIHGDIILDGEISSEPEIKYTGDKVSISTD